MHIRFTANNVVITGATNRTTALIRRSLEITGRGDVLKLSVSQIYDKVFGIRWVKSAVVQRKLPNTINIKIVERVPIAVFQHDHTSSLIDEHGELIEEVEPNMVRLPIVIGEDANTKVHTILWIISRFETFKDKIEVIKFVRKRRWDIVVSGLIVRLPEQCIEHAIETLAKMVMHRGIDKNTASCVDLRLHDSVVIKGGSGNPRQKGRLGV
jgi:cell division protein FtsQ